MAAVRDFAVIRGLGSNVSYKIDKKRLALVLAGDHSFEMMGLRR